MGLVEDVDLAAPADGRIGDALAQLADVVDRVVRRRVHLDHVERARAGDRDARLALARTARSWGRARSSGRPRGSSPSRSSRCRASRRTGRRGAPCPRSTAWRRVRTTGSWPTTSANVRGRCLRYRDRCCRAVAAPLPTPWLSLPTAGGRPRSAARATPRERVASAPDEGRHAADGRRARPRAPAGGAVHRRGRRPAAPDRTASASPTTTRSTRSPGAGSSRAAKPPPTGSRSPPPPTRCVELLGLVLSPLGAHAVRGRHGGARLPRAGGLRLGRSTGSARSGSGAAAGRARRAALPHARARPLLRRARLRGHPLPAARAGRPAGRDPPPAAPARRCSRCSRSPGLLRPEAWVFSGLYWLYLLDWSPRCARVGPGRAADAASRGELDCASRCSRRPRRWCGCSATWLVTGQPAVVADEHPPHRLDARPRHRDRQRPRVHPAADRRDPAPAGARSAPRSAGCCRCCGCAGARSRAPPPACSPCSCSPPSPRSGCRSTPATHSSRRRSCASSAAPACSAGRALSAGDPRRRMVDGGGRSCCVALLAYAPVAVPLGAPRTRQTGAPAAASKTTCWRSWTTARITLRCGPVGVPNHAPDPAARAVPEDQPRERSSAPRRGQIACGVYADPASTEVERDYVLDHRDPHVAGQRPAGLRRVGAPTARG